MVVKNHSFFLLKDQSIMLFSNWATCSIVMATKPASCFLPFSSSSISSLCYFPTGLMIRRCSIVQSLPYETCFSKGFLSISFFLSFSHSLPSLPPSLPLPLSLPLSFPPSLPPSLHRVTQVSLGVR